MFCHTSAMPHSAIHLDFDQFFNSIHDENMLSVLGSTTNHRLVTRAHPPILEGLLVCLVVVEISQHHTGGSDHKLAGCVVAGDFLALGGHDARLESRDQASRGAENNILGVGRADDSGGLRQTYLKISFAYSLFRH